MPGKSVVPLSPALRALLTKYNVAELIQMRPDRQEIMNGLYGPDHYRIEFAMLSVTPDADDPGLLHMRGKNRYKGVVTPFEGEIQLTQLHDQLQVNSEPDPTAQSVVGTFELREAADHKGAGVIKGQIAIDLGYRDGQLYRLSQSEKSAARGGDVKFEGTWTSNQTNKVQPVVWVADIFRYGAQVFDKFVIGERDANFNPKYARLGWDTYWQNEEWWADSDDARGCLQSRLTFEHE